MDAADKRTDLCDELHILSDELYLNSLSISDIPRCNSIDTLESAASAENLDEHRYFPKRPLWYTRKSASSSPSVHFTALTESNIFPDDVCSLFLWQLYL